MNFSRRMECFQCNASREGNAQPVDESGPRGPAAGLNNDNVVIVRDLSEYVEEDTLRRTFQSYGGLKEVRMVRDKYTQLGKGFAFIEFDRHQEALHVVEESTHRGVYVENSRVKCALARGKDAPTKGGNQGLASAAIEAAMALNASRMGGKAPSSSGRRRDEERADPKSVYGQPPAEGFELDPATGYFYNPETQQYYESATSLYYTFKDGQCYYFDNTTANYAACIGIGNPSAPRVEQDALAVPKAKKKGKGLGVSKKKAQKDIDSWTQAQDNADVAVQKGQPLSRDSGVGAGKAANMNNFKFEITNFNPEPPKMTVAPTPVPQPKPIVKTEFLPPPPSVASSSALPKQTSFICYLCNRKFNSQEMLTKHENLSDLHKKNLALATMKEKKRS